MGKRSRAERRARRKTNRANRKLKRADKKEAKGNTKRAEKLRARAAKLKGKAAVIKTQIDGNAIRGLTAQVVEFNELGNTKIKASWNYQANELQGYDELHLSAAPSSPIRSSTWNQKGTANITSSSFTFGLAKNLRYTIKLFGYRNGKQKLIDRTFVKKCKR